MSVFTPAEIEYLGSQRLCRLATVGANGQPHVVPVRFRYDPELDVIELGGHGFGTSKKFRDVQGNPLVALVVDDVTPPPPKPRGIDGDPYSPTGRKARDMALAPPQPAEGAS